MIPVHECGDVICEPCKKAIMRAYEGLRDCGRDDLSAFRAAVTLLSLRRPGRTVDDYERTVSIWLTDERDMKELPP